jgi:ssDNA thymidine ADP-ribosyltransferase, DarT
MTVPAQPKLYHIVHVDRLASIIEGGLLCDKQVMAHQTVGTTIGMNSIKQRRLQELKLTSHPDLYVGDCVPFYFCPRSIMLYLIYQTNHADLAYRGGQTPIVHLQADLCASVAWANEQQRRWAFTLSNAGSYYFEDRCDLNQLDQLDWPAIQTNQWKDCKEGKQAEFLMERSFPWQLIEKIGVKNGQIYQQVTNIVDMATHKPPVKLEMNWYY